MNIAVCTLLHAMREKRVSCLLMLQQGRATFGDKQCSLSGLREPMVGWPEIGRSRVARSLGIGDRAHLICFSHLRWNFVYQRPQHLLSRAAKDYSVLFFEEPLRAESGPAKIKSATTPEGVRVLTPLIPTDCDSATAIELQRKMLDAVLAETCPSRLIKWYYTPMALQFSGHLDAEACVYDNMDELSCFRCAPPHLLELEEELLARATVVFTGGHSLFEAKKNRHANIHAFPSSIDAVHFRQARGLLSPAPEDQVGIPSPRIGYFGVIDERLDLDLLAELAALRPAWQFIMIGPVAKIDPATLPRASNLHWIGQKAYAELPFYLAGWQAGIMPFAINEATRFISPTKTPEFLAAGVPVVSSPIADVICPYGEEELVSIASDADGFAAALERALTVPDHGQWLARVDRRLSTGSWDTTWSRMKSLIEAARRSAIIPDLRPKKGVALV
jgi:glycosyltransferase involved in cell wall biosynthesis